MDTERRPAITPEILMLLDLFDALRKRFGTEECKENWVGRLRRRSGVRHIPASVAELPPARPEVAQYLAARQTLAAVLAVHCQNCGRCELSER